MGKMARHTLSGAALGMLLLATTALGAQEPDAQQLFQQGLWADAAKAYEGIAAEQPENQQAWYRLGYALHALGRFEEALAAHERAADLTGSATATAAYNATCASARLGRGDDAVAWLGRAVSAGFGAGSMLDTDPDLDAVRDDPGFLAIRNPLVAKTVYRTFLRPAEQGDRDQFDFWIGDWRSTVHSLAAAGPWSLGRPIESRVYEVLRGNALVEWSASAQPGGPTQGFSIRTFDPARNEWIVLLNWPSKNRPSFYVFTGRFRHGRCDLVNVPSGAGRANQTRFSFSDVQRDGYRWDSATTTDGGKSWSTSLVFEGQRRAASAPPLRTGPSTTFDHCPGPEFRQFDFRLGTWIGKRRTRAADGEWREAPVRMHCYSAMEGSAVVEEHVLGDGDGRLETFAIECFEPARGKWVRYSIDDRRPRFRRFEGVVAEGPVELVGARGPGSSGAPGTLVLTRPGAESEARELRTAWRASGETVWQETLRAVD